MKDFEKLPGIKKIAVLRANALGDFIFILPALEALRQTYSGAEIVLLGKQWHYNFLTHRPGPVDRVVVIPGFEGIGNAFEPQEINEEAQAAFFEKMVNEEFDLAVQLYGGGKFSNPFIIRLGAKFTIGLKAADAPPLDRWVPYVYYQPEIIRYLEVVSLVGAPPVDLNPRLNVTARDREEISKIIELYGQPLVALHPGATDPRRRWPPEKFAQLGDRLGEKGFEVVVTGTAPENDLVEAVVAGMKQKPLGLAGKLSTGGLLGLLANCTLVVSNDSGPLHLAFAAGTPVVGIYWCGNMFTSSPVTRTGHRPVSSWQLNCSDCGVNCLDRRCEHNSSFVAGIEVEEVLGAGLELL